MPFLRYGSQPNIECQSQGRIQETILASDAFAQYIVIVIVSDLVNFDCREAEVDAVPLLA